MTIEYPQIDDYILNDSGINVDEYDDYQSFLGDIIDLFGNQFNDEVGQTTLDIWEENQVEPEPEQFYEKLQPSQQKKIEDIVQSPITKREQTVKVLETVKKEITIAEFIETTGMNPNTARRELGQGVKKGLFKRVRKGVYEELWDVKYVKNVKDVLLRNVKFVVFVLKEWEIKPKW